MAALYFFFRRFVVSGMCLLGLCMAISTYATATATTHGQNKVGTHKPTVSKAKPHWQELTATQQQILSPLASGWNQLSAFRKKKWLKLADHYAKMSPTAQARMQTRMRAWIKLSPEQRRKVRQNYLNSKKLTPEQKVVQWKRYQQLPDSKKKKLAATPTKKTIVNPPLMHNMKKTTSKPVSALAPTSTPATITSAPTLTDNDQVALPDINYTNEPESDPPR